MNTNKTNLSKTFDEALCYAAEAHRLQTRKSTASPGAESGAPEIPYLGHLLGAASIVIDAGGSEEEAIAALLHDAAEDQGGEPRLADIAATFGKRVAEIVRGCSDALTENPHAKPPWRARKERYIAHLKSSADVSIHLVSAADKCNNARTTARDLAFAADPAQVWSKFNPAAGPDGTLWYYRSLIAAYRAGPRDDRRELIVSDLSQAVDEMAALIALHRAGVREVEDPF
jgi:(p)ppGpp synthase/HD superfamily hydrolase